MANWHPRAVRVLYPSAGAYTAKLDKPTLCWHTTETKGLPTYDGTQPHFTFNPRSNQLWQHQTIAEAAKALVGQPPSPVPTNKANCIQVELICYSNENAAAQAGGLAVSDLTDGDYGRIAALARWIETNAGVKRRSSVAFKEYPDSAGAANGVRLSQAAWLKYEGHLGHQHMPANVHGDPSNLKIKAVLDLPVTQWEVHFRNAKHELVTAKTRDKKAWIDGHPGAFQRGNVVFDPIRP